MSPRMPGRRVVYGTLVLHVNEPRRHDLPAPLLDYASPPPPLPLSTSRTRAVVIGLLLLVGLQCWLVFGRGYWGRNVQLLGLCLLAALAVIPAVHRTADRLLDGIRHPSRRALTVASVLIALAGSTYLYLDARYQERTFTPKYHDEFSYLVQARHLAQGKLWMPAHPLADHFDSFQLIASPVYGSIYFPGAALFYVPGIWLGLPSWMIPLLLAGAVTGLLFRAVSELVDAVAGGLAAIMLLSLPIFRLQALMAMSTLPAMVLTLSLFLCWLSWRRAQSIGWAIGIGLCTGWAAITRPLDALCIALPIAIAMAWRARHTLDSPILRRTVLAALLTAAPFLILQVVFNRAVTGSVLTTPFDYYADASFPQTSYGFHRFDPAVRPRSDLPQKQVYYDNVALPFIRSHNAENLLTNWRDSRLRLTVVANAPSWLMIALMPAGLLMLNSAGRRVLWATFPLFIALYFGYTFFLAHYPLVVAPAIILNILLGAEAVALSFPRARTALTTFFTASLTMLALTELPELNRVAHDEWFEGAQLRTVDRAIEHLATRPAIVLFRFGGKANCEEEPVYNTGVAWPDDAVVIRAHDLGTQRNTELFRYYAARDEDRGVYLYDRADDSIRYLGTVGELSTAEATIMRPATDEGAFFR